MARHQEDESLTPRRRSPARTLEERESVLISKAHILIERQLDDGTAPATVLAQYAKLGSTREKLEQERMQNEIEVLRKKVQSMEAAIDVKNLMSDALKAFRGYSGQPDDGPDDEYDE